MLGKLLKYEIKATGRTFLPLYLALIVLTIITKVLLFVAIPDAVMVSESGSNFDLPLVISLSLYGTIIVALFVLTLIVIIQRFYKNLLTDEGYLMFTMPVQTWKLILSKLLTAILWTIVCGFAVAISIFILALGNFSMMELSQEIGKMYSEFQNQFGMSLNIIIGEGIMLMIVDIISSILMIYVAIAIGQLFNQHRILASFGAYIGITVILQIVMSLLTLLFPVFGMDYLMSSEMNEIAVMQIFINSVTVFNIICIAAFYFITNYILKNRLNLE
ncbi:hypothetical protein [Acetobacterium bakii]|uniref:Uncharacterized protein n=1 Tax=Acetobacterium bakii TaxID=52689 RepID=A0A0L6U4R4_9FIRM|nr:hypothetical protein [Acetobacterium bakii]KNZ43506.1 hypothetical protein AKG39_00980 [Acetobacterium bakii]